MFDFIHDKERARVRIDFEVDGVSFKAGEWVEGHFVYVGNQGLHFETRERFVIPDYFDRFDIPAFTLEDTLAVDLGTADDREQDDDESSGDDDE